jgi:GT2 family glycosyltransferase
VPFSPRVTAVILNWNGGEYLSRCVDHALGQRGTAPQVVVVDNASTDGSLDRLPVSSRIETLRLSSNSGFAAGMNAGIEHALQRGADLVWLLNVDAFADPDCLTQLLARVADDPGLWIVTPRLLNEDGTEQHAGGTVDWYNGDLGLLRSSSLRHAPDDRFWVTGAAPMIRASVFRTAGVFEPAFFAYWEDVDLCARVWHRGGRVAAEPSAVVTHVGSASLGSQSPGIAFLRTRNAWLFLERNGRLGAPRARWLRFVSSTLERAASLERTGSHDAAVASLAGLSAARRRQYGRPPQAMVPAAFEAFCFRHPWRMSGIFTRVANLIEPTGRVRLQPEP